jgi:GT2 family glycosyltransferase
MSEKVFGHSDWLCFLDNDVAVFEGWLSKAASLLDSEAIPMLLGGQRHPYHGVTHRLYGVEEVDAVAGYSMFMSWDTWDRFGPFDANAKGIGQSEDWAFSQRVKKGGGIVGYIHPPVLAHCGLTNTDSKPATGHEAFERFPGLIYE